MKNMPFDAAVYILLGQSKAVGHGVPMKENDIIKNTFKKYLWIA